MHQERPLLQQYQLHRQPCFNLSHVHVCGQEACCLSSCSEQIGCIVHTPTVPSTGHHRCVCSWWGSCKQMGVACQHTTDEACCMMWMYLGCASKYGDQPAPILFGDNLVLLYAGCLTWPQCVLLQWHGVCDLLLPLPTYKTTRTQGSRPNRVVYLWEVPIRMLSHFYNVYGTAALQVHTVCCQVARGLRTSQGGA